MTWLIMQPAHFLLSPNQILPAHTGAVTTGHGWAGMRWAESVGIYTVDTITYYQ